MKRFFAASSWSSGLLLAIFLLVGCDGITDANEQAETETTDELTELTVLLTDELALSADQSATMQSALHDDDDRMRGAGALWYLAAHLQATLSDEQKQRLFDRTARFDSTRAFDSDLFVGFSGPGRFGPSMGPGAFNMFPYRDLLTAEQQDQVKELLKTYREAFRELATQRRDDVIDAEAFRQEVETLRDALKDDLDALLTDEQRDEIEQRREEEREARQDALAERREAEFAAMVDALALSQEDADAVRAILEAMHAELEAIREQLQEGSLDLGAARLAMHAAQETAQASIAALLDDTQLEIVQIHRALSIRRDHVRHTNGGPSQGLFGSDRQGPGQGPNGDRSRLPGPTSGNGG